MKTLLLIFLASGLLFACNNDKKTTTTETEKDNTATTSNNTSSNTPSSGDNKIVFTVDGKLVETAGLIISLSDIGTGLGTRSLNIKSDNFQDTRSINLNVNAEKPGTYSMATGLDANKAGAANGSYRPDFTNDLSNVYYFESGEVTIQSIDVNARLLNATFHGVAKNAKGETVTITDGKVINGKLLL